MKPIILYAHPGPNPWKVHVVLSELDLPFELKMLEFPDMKKEPYTSVNPNGRVPSIEDPNTGVTVAESGAILQYLVETYDKDNKLHYTSSPEKYKELQWLHFQMSGQGPYFGQKAWFSNYHSEKLPSAEERYAKEIKRVLGVIDQHLKKQGTEYLIGDKVSYADLAWIPWNNTVGWLLPGWDYTKELPVFAAWHQRLLDRPAVKKTLEAQAAARSH